MRRLQTRRVRLHLRTLSYCPGSRLSGQLDTDGGELVRFRLKFNGAAVGFHDPPGNAQTKTAAINLAVVRRISAVEPIEYAWEFFRRNAVAGVRDRLGQREAAG